MDIPIPIMVINLFKEQINNVKIDLIKKIAEDYNLDADELIKEYTCDIEIISKSLENIEITKKHKYASKVKDEWRCEARVFNNGNGGRCKRTVNENNLCSLHNIYLKNNGKLKCGLITEPKPKNIFKYKNPKSEKLY